MMRHKNFSEDILELFDTKGCRYLWKKENAVAAKTSLSLYI